MSEWCIAHPWMTFFIVIALVNGFRLRINWTRKVDKP